MHCESGKEIQEVKVEMVRVGWGEDVVILLAWS